MPQSDETVVDTGPFFDAVEFARNDFIEPFEAWAERLLLANVALSEALAAHNRRIRQSRTAAAKQRDAAWYRAQIAVLKGESSAPLLVRRINDLRRSWRMHRLHAVVIPNVRRMYAAQKIVSMWCAASGCVFDCQYGIIVAYYPDPERETQGFGDTRQAAVNNALSGAAK